MQYLPSADEIGRHKREKENAKEMAVLRVPQAQVRLQEVRRSRRRRSINQALELVQQEVAGASGKVKFSTDMPFFSMQLRKSIFHRAQQISNWLRRHVRVQQVLQKACAVQLVSQARAFESLTTPLQELSSKRKYKR